MNWKTHADKKRAKMIKFGAIWPSLVLSRKKPSLGRFVKTKQAQADFPNRPRPVFGILPTVHSRN